MFTEGIYPIGDGLLDIDETRLKGLLVPDDINEIYEVEQTPFARGKFAAVRRAVHKNSGVHFAAKFLKRRRRAQSSDKEIKHEIAVLTLCDGAENIVKLNAVHESRSDTALLLELATGGELQTFLDNEECLNEAHARICMREVLKALQFLHKRSIAHLDLKPQNILLSGERIEDGLKLCDFGISRVVAEGTQVREIVGTPDYVAPEVLQYEPLSLLSDIWSVGVLAYVLLSGFSPFGGDTKQETFLNISQCALEFPDKLFGGVSGAAIDFIRRSLRIKPSDRMSAAGCLEHSWLKDECPMSRQLYITKKKTENEDVDEEDEDRSLEELDVDEEDDEDDEDVDEEDEDDDDDAEISRGFIVDVATKMDSSCSAAAAVRLALPPKPIMMNGVKQPVTSTATHVVVSPPARRQSCDATEANKENTYLATKKITPSTSSNTTTIIIGATELTEHGHAAAMTSSQPPHITTVTVPNVTTSPVVVERSNGSEKSPCLFPDAPTTPKVIRKAPNTDTSPTSVKALVKKFQLEGGDCCKTTTTTPPPQQQQQQTLKEAHGNHQHQHQHHHQAQVNGKTTIATLTNGKLCVKMPEKDGGEKAKKFPINGRHSNGGSGCCSTSTIACNFSGRRASEPAAGIHKKSLMSQQQQQQHNQRSSTDSAVMVNSFRSTCVFGLNSDGTATITTTPNGCRHPTITLAVNTNGSTSSCSKLANGDAGDNSNSNSGSSVTAMNGSGSASTSASASSTTNAVANTSTAILFANHHQLHHHTHPHSHHHHHHHVAKNVAATNLSLDQGIIC